MYTHIHIHIHIHMYLPTHTYTLVQAYIYIYLHTQIYINSCAHKYSHEHLEASTLSSPIKLTLNDPLKKKFPSPAISL